MAEKQNDIIKQVLRLLVEDKDITPEEQVRILAIINKE